VVFFFFFFLSYESKYTRGSYPTSSRFLILKTHTYLSYTIQRTSAAMMKGIGEGKQRLLDDSAGLAGFWIGAALGVVDGAALGVVDGAALGALLVGLFVGLLVAGLLEVGLRVLETGPNTT